MPGAKYTHTNDNHWGLSVFSIIHALDLLSLVWIMGKSRCCVAHDYFLLKLPWDCDVRPQPSTFRERDRCLCAQTRSHPHAPLAAKHWQFPKEQFAPVTPCQVSLHHKAQQLKCIREAALEFGGRITNLCLQFANPIIAMYVDHYSHVIKIWCLLLFCGNCHFLRFRNSPTLTG